MSSGESVMLQELLLNVHTIYIEKKPSLSLLSTQSSSGRKEGRGGQQMTPEFLNSIFAKGHMVQTL